jgi:hypothetical protein
MNEANQTFYAIDFDRCLSDTEKLDEIFYQLIAEYKELDSDQLLKAKNEIENNGGSFDQVEALQSLLSPEKLQELFDEFIERALAQDTLCPGASELLKSLEQNKRTFGIVSYGNPLWQTIKMKASGVDTLPALITDHKRKGEIIASWQQGDKTFLIPSIFSADGVSIQAKTVVLIDDKAVAFGDLPDEARGYWVQSLSGIILPSQTGDIPENVRIAHGLSQIMAFESLS